MQIDRPTWGYGGQNDNAHCGPPANPPGFSHVLRPASTKGTLQTPPRTRMVFIYKTPLDNDLKKFPSGLMGSSSSAAFLAFVNFTLADLGDKFKGIRIWGPRSIFIAVILLTRARQRTTYRSMMLSFMADTAGFLRLNQRPSLAGLSQARKKIEHRSLSYYLTYTPGVFRKFTQPSASPA